MKTPYTRGFSTILSCSVLLCLFMAPRPTHAQGLESRQDYGLAHQDWNGLSDLAILAQSEGMELEFLTTFDYGALDLEEPLLIIYPNQELRADSLARFVIDGGRVILADDFGQSESFLKRLDIDRQTPDRGGLPHQVFFENNPALPVLRAQGTHPLLTDVDFIIANHPAVLYNVGGPVLKYTEDGGLVYDMNLGEGKVVVIGDASLFINHMLSVADNESLIRNAFSYVCKVSTRPRCRVRVLVGDFAQTGTYGSSEDLLGDREEVSLKIEELNETIRSIMEQLPASKLFYYLAILIAAGLVAYLAAIFPLRKTRPYSAYVQDTLRAVHQPQGEFDWNLARYANVSGATNYALPISILKEIVEELILKKMGLWEKRGIERATVSEIVQRFVKDYLASYPPDLQRKLEKKMTNLLATFASVPTRQRIFLDSDTFFGERDLIALHEDSMEILDIMELKESYERRIRLHI